MAYRASPARKVTEFSKDTIEAAEAAPAVAADFVNLERSTIVHDGGFAQGEFALLPDKHDYDHLRFVFGPTTLGNTVTSATITIWVRGSDGSVHIFGSSDLTAGQFPAIEGENYQGTYAATVSAIAGTDQELSVDVFVQGVHVGYVA